MQNHTLSIQYPSGISQFMENGEVTFDSANIQNLIIVSEPTGANIKNSIVIGEPAGSGPSEFMTIAIVLGLIVGIPLTAGINFVIYRFLFNVIRKKVLKKYSKGSV
jgi:hypothetical protein